MNKAEIFVGDVRTTLEAIPDKSVQCCVTSPPYWGLRDYGDDGQIGLEQTPDEYVSEMVAVFRQVHRILADDGVLWLNLGDTYAGNNSRASNNGRAGYGNPRETVVSRIPEGLKPKDLIGIPWRVAFALQADGWWLRQDIIWHKPNPMPESVTDRCTKSHEYVFLLTKDNRYFFNHEAIKEPAVYAGDNRGARTDSRRGTRMNSMSGVTKAMKNKRNVWKQNIDIHKMAQNIYEYALLNGMGASPDIIEQMIANEIYDVNGMDSVWTLSTKPFKGAHFAVMPESLVLPCVLAGSKPGDTVLDPFTGSGTVAVVALDNGRNFVGTEINSEYADIAYNRIIERKPETSKVMVVRTLNPVETRNHDRPSI